MLKDFTGLFKVGQTLSSFVVCLMDTFLAFSALWIHIGSGYTVSDHGAYG